MFENVAEGLEQKGLHVSRVYSDFSVPPGAIREEDNARFISLSVPPAWRSLLRPTYAYRFFASLIAAYKLLHRLRPDAVNIHFFMTSALHFVLLKPLFNYRLVISCHGSDTVGFHGMKKRMSPFIFEQADAVTCVSEAVADQLKREAPGAYDTKIIYNGIDVDFWVGGDQEIQKVKGRVVSVGALREVKGHDVLIRAFQKVVDEIPDASLRIIGDGDKRVEYESLINDLGLSEHVTIAGWLAKTDVRNELHQASLFVLPSRNEGFGLALVEAIASGLPVVATNVGGVPEVVSDFESILVPPNNHVALSDAICDSLRAHDEPLTSKSLRTDTVFKFDLRKTVIDYQNNILLGINRISD